MIILIENYMKLLLLIVICLFFSFIGAAADPSYISINCGGAAAATALGGRQWLGDAAPEGSSRASTVKGEMITAVDPVPYKTARISLSQFSYSFHLTLGQKIIRLHFNPVTYHGFDSFDDLFTVEAGPYTLLANFSASITARALAVNTFAKEFCITVQETQHLHILFSPETKYNCAFINGIEIISVPPTISYCHGGDSGIHVLGQNYVVHLDNSTALEIVHRQNIKWGSDDGMFGMWGGSSYSYNRNRIRMWRVGVDVGFRYLVRLHLCELGLKMHYEFILLINDMIAFTSPHDLLHQLENKNLLWYNYMVIVEGQKREGKRNISISLQSQHDFLDKHGPFEGFEVFKLSNHDRSLAAPNPPNPPLSSKPIHSRIGCTTAVITVLCLATIIFRMQQKIRCTEEEDRAKRPCRCFTLAEIQVATQSFHEGSVIGKGGFGKVYKGFVDNGRELVAIKRLKPDSGQGEREFWTEIQTLSELRHVNLVSLIGYCIEQKEMILVYEYMPYGTLADHLYKLARKNKYFHPLSWKQRLKICIGVGRAIDYLHTGTGRGIIHRDVKTSNILLDERFVAKISDFGLAKSGFGSESQSQDSTQVKGTRGYLDPYYRETHRLTQKSDTYSFGVVLLEILSEIGAGEPVNEEGKPSNLTTWAKEKISKGGVDDIVAPSLKGEISADSLNTFVKVAERCLFDQPKERPAMTHIIIELELALMQQEQAETTTAAVASHMLPNEITNASDDGDKKVITTEMQMMNSERKDGSGRRTLMRRVSHKLWPTGKNRKSSHKTDLLGTSLSAPITACNIALPGKG